jgi:hypothetical protein
VRTENIWIPFRTFLMPHGGTSRSRSSFLSGTGSRPGLLKDPDRSFLCRTSRSSSHVLSRTGTRPGLLKDQIGAFFAELVRGLQRSLKNWFLIQLRFWKNLDMYNEYASTFVTDAFFSVQNLIVVRVLLRRYVLSCMMSLASGEKGGRMGS